MSRLKILPRFCLLLLACFLSACILPPAVRAQPPAPAAEVPAPAAVPPPAPPLAPAAHPATPDEAFTRALTAYKAGALEDARREFLAIVAGGHLSAPLAHNLGNLEFRLGEPGQAVLWYKRAAALQPFSPETLQNLRAVRRQTAFLSFDAWGLLSLSHIKPPWIETGTILTAWAVGLLILWLAWLTPRRGRRWPLVTLLSLGLPILACGTFLTWHSKADPHPLVKRWIVSGKETNAFAAPAEAASTLMRLPPGSEVVPLETRGNWLYCTIPAGGDDPPVRGWIRSVTLEPLWPYAAGL